jgi:signal transduction histidine kinase
MAITIEVLSQYEPFETFTDQELEQIIPLCHEMTSVEGQRILVEGQQAKRLVVVKQGKLSLEKKLQLGRGAKTRLATVGYVGPGKTAGWSTLVPPHVYTSTAVCTEPTQLIAVDGPALRQVAQQSPEIGIKLMSLVSTLIKRRYQTATDTLAYFLSIVSHELRSPLAAIENYLNVILDGYAGEVTDKQRRFLERSNLRINDLRSLVSDLVDLARMKPEQIQADFEWLDPFEVGVESIEDVRLASKQKKIRIITEHPEEFQPFVGARRRLRQVLTNLLSNAVKFSPDEGQVTFRGWDEAEALVFQVEDQGMGIPPEDQPYIFEDFFRSRNAEGVAGAGLGLSVAKSIVEAHEGQIELESPYEGVESGTRFTVRLPRHLCTPEMRREEWKQGGIG